MMINHMHVAWIVVVLLAMALPNTTEGAIGMNWGRVSAQRLLPTQVVDLLLQNGIGHARIFSSEIDILSAFSGSGINLTMGITNPTTFATSIEAARAWVKWKANYFTAANARRVIIGESIFAKGLNNIPFLESSIKGLENTQTALKEEGFDHIKATFTHSIDVLKKNISKPSEAEFMDEIKQQMMYFVRFLEAHDSPFLLIMFPISDTIWLNFDESFAFPDNKSTHVVKDVNGAVYTNTFEFMYDSFIWALKKINAPENIPVIVSQVGWPTDGYEGANASSAERFYKGLLPMVVSNKGTPMRPGAPIDIFIHALADEPKMPFVNNYPFTRHWGIYRSNGLPKYKIDLSGQGRDMYPTEVKGVMRMPERWCLFNKNMTDVKKVQWLFDEACKITDCSSLYPGGSCSHLTYDQNISYAFNKIFQNYFQDEAACDFGGLGFVSVDDPSTVECLFPVEVVRGQQNNYVPYVPPVIAATSTSFAKRLHRRPEYAIFLAVLLLMMATFIL